MREAYLAKTKLVDEFAKLKLAFDQLSDEHASLAQQLEERERERGDTRSARSIMGGAQSSA